MVAAPASLDARAVIARLALAPHPEGGYYRETYRDPLQDGNGRSRSTAILFLLGAGDVSDWHRIDAPEIWHFHAGAPLVITLSPNGHDASAHRLGPNLLGGETPQMIVPSHCWQTATSLGAWTLVGCTVAPGFDFATFERAPRDWRPTPRA